MPKVKWINGQKKPRKPVNHLAATLREYRRASGLTSSEIAQRVGCSPENVRHQMAKPADQWQIGRLRQYCAIIGCPIEEALAAAAK